MKRFIIAALVGLLAATAAFAQGRGFDQLDLNGLAAFEQLRKEYYVGALYLDGRASDPAAVLAAAGKKRMALHITADRWPPMFDVIGKRRWFYLVSLLLTIPGLIFILISPISDAGLQLTIDYTGGTRWEIKFADANVTPDQVEEDFEEPEPDELLLVRIPPGAARAFVKRAQALVAAGRPPCPLCALPLDPEGHVCPRQNGHMRQG